MRIDDVLDFQIYKDTDREAMAVSELIDKFEELEFIPNLGKIIVVSNNKKKIKKELLEAGGANVVTLTRIPPKYKGIISQLTSTEYTFCLEIVHSAFEDAEGGDEDQKLDFNQLKALMYFELRKIRHDGKVGKIRANDWIRILHGLGKGFDRLDTSCTDILAEDFSWEKVLGSYDKSLEYEED